MKIDMPTVEAMKAKGIEFLVNLRVPGGGNTIGISSKDVPAIMADKDQFAADHFRVTKQDYLRWVETNGSPQCGATTKAGTRCTRDSAGKYDSSIKAWLRMDGQYCKLHGGEG